MCAKHNFVLTTFSSSTPSIYTGFIYKYDEEGNVYTALSRFDSIPTEAALILGIMAGARNTWILVKGVIKPDHKGSMDHEKKNK